jgi:hypothetical protein
MADRSTVEVKGAMNMRIVAALLAALVAVAALGAGLMAQAAGAAPKVTGFTMAVSTSQAGGHPDFDLQTTLDTRQTVADPTDCACVDPEEIITQFPPGVIGDPHALPVCTLLALSEHNCPVESQVGIASAILGQEPLYNMEPHPDEPGLVGFAAPLINAPVFIALSARTDSDYGLTATSGGIFHLLPLAAFGLHLWGVPGDPKHDINRWPAPQGGFGLCGEPYPVQCNPAQSFNAPVRPYFENPTACGEPLSLRLDALFYDNTLAHAEGVWPSTTGCDQLTFNPNLTAKPTTTQADSASGLDVHLSVPQTQSPSTPSPSEIKAATLTLPPGFSINPNAADGKTTCSDDEASFGTTLAAQCPEHAKVGTLSLDSSALPAPIPGAIYLGDPLPGDTYRLFLTADGFATHVKIAGTVTPDPATGQLVTSFPHLPQSPFQAFDMHFFGSERGLLATPTECGTYPVNTTFVPWDSALPNQTSTSSITVDGGPNGTACPAHPRAFHPQFRAGAADNTAGSYTPFGLELSRDDGDQNMEGLTVHLPPGFSAKLAGISYCSDAALASLSGSGYSGLLEQTSPLCPASSRVGTAIIGAGAGSRPIHTPGSVYLAGPYGGAPISLVTVVPAVSGPYDLGNAAVRSPVFVNPATVEATAVAYEIPKILAGIPLRLRSIRIDLDRSGFMLNPTNCDHFSVAGQATGSEGATVPIGEPFQVANCASLPYAPSLSLRLSGGVNRLGHPAIHATYSQQPGEANSSMVQVSLPPNEILDNGHVGNICTRPDFDAGKCPASSLIGVAEAKTPLLDKPLKGNVYLRANPSRSLPDVVADLNGQIDVTLAGRVGSTKSGGLKTTFDQVPDAPVTFFKLDLQGGAKGLLQNSVGLCGKADKKAQLRLIGQNGAVLNSNSPLRTSCGSGARHKRHRHGTGRAR